MDFYVGTDTYEQMILQEELRRSKVSMYIKEFKRYRIGKNRYVVQLSLFEKSGLFKVRVHLGLTFKFHVYKGGTLLFQSDKLNSLTLLRLWQS